MENIIQELFPIHRSITGDGVRKTLGIIKREIPQLVINSIKSGKEVFDWTIPQEWKVNKAYIKEYDDNGKILIDFFTNNLYLIHYSSSINAILSYEELKSHVYTLPEQVNDIPYITSYYGKRTWGFSMSHNEWDTLFKKEKKYEVVIDTQFKNGYLNYGEIIIQGKTRKTILLSTYICHPSLANDNLSGIVLTIFLAKFLLEKNALSPLHYTYRIVFLPETIGSIAYLHDMMITKSLFTDSEINKTIIGGYVITCVGKKDIITYIQTRKPSLTDKITEYVLHHYYKEIGFRILDFTHCGSDERQYNYPNVDIPIGSITRAKYSEYIEYHTSADNLSIISADVIRETMQIYEKCLWVFENNIKYTCLTFCEPHMIKYNLYPGISNVSGENSLSNRTNTRLLMNILRYCDGEMDLIDIQNRLTLSQPTNNNIETIIEYIDILTRSNLIIESDFVTRLTISGFSKSK